MSDTEREAIVGIGEKPVVERRATATGVLHLSENSVAAIKSSEVSKGDVIEASTVAAVQAVKMTPNIVPHCHPIPIEGCTVDWEWEGNSLRCTVKVSARYRTGVEMEALTGVSVGLLCAWDMVKPLEKDESGQYPIAQISDIHVTEKYKGTALANVDVL